MFADVADKPPTGALAFRTGQKDAGIRACGDVCKNKRKDGRMRKKLEGSD